MSNQSSKKKAVVLLSGGLDSATTLAIAKQQKFAVYALSFRYGQRHTAELRASEKIAEQFQVEQHRVFDLDLSLFTGSALTDASVAVPQQAEEGIPVTYVPARNTIFLSIALGWAEVLGARDIFIGVNAVDYSGYPDCRPQFIEAFERMANLATKVGVEGDSFKIHCPLLSWSKKQIIEAGTGLGLDYAITVSCYQATEEGLACGRCDACRLRKQGFVEAGMVDPTTYHN